MSALLSLTTQGALNPLVTAPLLVFLTKTPHSRRESILRNALGASLPKIIKTLKWLLALGLANRLNRALNQAALNGWRFRTKEKLKWDWKKEIAVVTGGSSGIGELVVKGLAARGVRVAVLDVLPLSEELEKDPLITFYACDITDASAVASTADSIRADLGAPSILINNAGIAKSHGILDTTDEFLKKLFAVNLFSHWSAVRAFLPDMIKSKKGHIISVASLASYVTVTGLADYCATKAGVLAFHQGLNTELRTLHHTPEILTTSVHPSWVATALTSTWQKTLKGHRATLLSRETIADAILKQIFDCKGGQIILPPRVSWMTMMAGLPNWMQEVVRSEGSKSVLDAQGKLMGT